MNNQRPSEKGLLPLFFNDLTNNGEIKPMSTTVTSPSYKFPRRNTYPSAILVELLDGNRITNAQMMDKLNCPHAASVMGHLRNACRWGNLIQDRTKSTHSGLGELTHEKEYWFEGKDIANLKANDPRIEKFLKANRKS